MQNQNQQEIVVGYATFYSTTNNLNNLLSKIERDILNKEIWCWEPNHYNAFLWKQIFLNIKNSSCTTLQLNKLQIPFIIKDIEHINFTELKHLTLDTNNIVNVENLQYLNMTKLVRLNLCQNQICQLSFFHKQNMPFIQEILFQINPIKSIETLNKCQMLSNINVIKRISIQFSVSQYPSIDDLSQIAKYNCRDIGVFRYTQSNRINQQKLKKMLSKKYKRIRFTTQNLIMLD